jgi:hypothetical protein
LLFLEGAIPRALELSLRFLRRAPQIIRIAAIAHSLVGFVHGADGTFQPAPEIIDLS